MGMCLNEGNRLYWQSTNSEIHVDKSLLIRETNKRLDTDDKYICLSRPRRFGKSMAAHMLMAYYSCGCDSRELFADKKIASDPSFARYLNQYNVIHLRMTDYSGCDVDSLKSSILKALKIDIRKEVAEFADKPEFSQGREFEFFNEDSIVRVLQDFFEYSGRPYVFIIDEWDVPMRENGDDEPKQKAYLDFLRDLLKDREYVALAYATGILPVKKYGAHSALNMFKEYSMERSYAFAPYYGFTREETLALCGRYSIDGNEAIKWYDGYLLDGQHMTNPRSIVDACLNHDFDTYWNSTETYEALRKYIILDMDGLRERVERLIAGERVGFSMKTYQNDMTRFNSAEDVLALLVHLGYLTYDKELQCGWIPNNEVAIEFVNSIKNDRDWDAVMRALNDSAKCLDAILAGDADTVAALIERSHQENTSIIRYNDENSLACVVALALYSSRNRYVPFRELPSGKGYADIVLLPRHGQSLPAIAIELKAESSPSIALDQIRRREYPEVLKDLVGEVILVGIDYSTDPHSPGYKHHACAIEKISKNMGSADVPVRA